MFQVGSKGIEWESKGQNMKTVQEHNCVKNKEKLKIILAQYVILAVEFSVIFWCAFDSKEDEWTQKENWSIYILWCDFLHSKN